MITTLANNSELLQSVTLAGKLSGRTNIRCTARPIPTSDQRKHSTSNIVSVPRVPRMSGPTTYIDESMSGDEGDNEGDEDYEETTKPKKYKMQRVAAALGQLEPK